MPRYDYQNLPVTAGAPLAAVLCLIAACGDDRVASSCGVSRVWAANANTCATTLDGRFWCWGLNDFMALGDGSTTSRSRPVQPKGPLSSITEVAVSSGSVCAVVIGRLWCWGTASVVEGEASASIPTLRSEFSDPVTRVAASSWWICVTEGDGSVWCRGDNTYGMLGTGDTVPSTTPVPVSLLSEGVLAIAAEADSQTYALKDDGSLWRWGPSAPSPVPDLIGRPIAQVDLESSHVCALDRGGKVLCWGSVPVEGLGEIPFFENPVELIDYGDQNERVAVGKYMLCVLRGGTVLCSGFGPRGELGDGTTADRFTPAPVVGLPGAVAEIDAGYRYACVRLVDDTLWCCGVNYYGQLGVGDTQDRSLPTQVTFPSCQIQ